MAHTPGPWREIPTTRRTSRDMYDIVADAPGGGTYNIVQYVQRDNAALIAAAPDLLAACKDVYDWMSRFGKDYGVHAELSEMLHAAIAKAEPQKESASC